MALIFCRPDMTSIYLYDEINSPASCRKIKSYVLFFMLCYFVYIYTYIYIYVYVLDGFIVSERMMNRKEDG